MTKNFITYFRYFSIALVFLISIDLASESNANSKKEATKNIYAVEPKYPSAAENRGLEGYAVVEFTINEKGKTKDIVVKDARCGKLISNSNPLMFKYGSRNCSIFNSSAIDAAKKLRYRPPVINGEPASIEDVRWRYRFESANDNDISALDIPRRKNLSIEKGLRAAKNPSGRTIKKVESIALKLVEEFPDVSFHLGKIYTFMGDDDLALKYFKDFLEIEKQDKELNKDITAFYIQGRSVYQASALAIITEKLYQKSDYKQIIKLADIIKTQQIFVKNNKGSIKDTVTLIEFSNFYLGISYLFEGYLNEGKETLLWVKERSDNTTLVSAIDEYLLQINETS